MDQAAERRIVFDAVYFSVFPGRNLFKKDERQRIS